MKSQDISDNTSNMEFTSKSNFLLVNLLKEILHMVPCVDIGSRILPTLGRKKYLLSKYKWSEKMG